MILSCQNICKTFVEKPVLQNISFHLNENDRLAIIGYNGAGKSTLLKILILSLIYIFANLLCPDIFFFLPFPFFYLHLSYHVVMDIDRFKGISLVDNFYFFIVFW